MFQWRHFFLMNWLVYIIINIIIIIIDISPCLPGLLLLVSFLFPLFFSFDFLIFLTFRNKNVAHKKKKNSIKNFHVSCTQLLQIVTSYITTVTKNSIGRILLTNLQIICPNLTNSTTMSFFWSRIQSMITHCINLSFSLVSFNLWQFLSLFFSWPWHFWEHPTPLSIPGHRQPGELQLTVNSAKYQVMAWSHS